MYHHYFGTTARKLACLAFVGLVSLLVLSGLHTSASIRSSATPQEPVAAKSDIHPEFLTNNYKQTNLVSDLPGFAQIQDPLLVNPWGVAYLATSPFWVANQQTSSATLYGGDISGSPFFKNALNVTIPGLLPTGAVSNSSGTDFTITSGGGTGPARFIFASITGNIIAWRAGSVASIQRSKAGHNYTGLAIGNNGTSNFLYAADFANKKIDVYNNTFADGTLVGTFTDPGIPVDFAPFNIQNLGGTLFVLYAKIDPATGRDLPGAGNGFVSKFDTNGNFLGRLISNGPLNSPWGLTVSPAGFGSFGNRLLVGNFGDGKINAFDITTGAFLGTLNDELGSPIIIPGLWAILFGNGVGGGDTSALYFSAGYDSERHGLFGSLRSSTPALTSIQLNGAAGTVSETAPVTSVDVFVNRTGDITGTSTVNYATFDDSAIVPATIPASATQGKDYLLAAGTLTFTAGQTSKSFTILIPDDAYQESNETINVVLSNPTGAALGSPSTGILTITDNDTPTITPVQRTFIATLNSAQENPPNASTGRGVGIVQLAADELSAKTSLYFTGLTGNPAAGHIHGPALAGSNAGVIFPFSGLPAATSGSLNNFTLVPAPTSTQVQDLKTARQYQNLHTPTNGGGEIRGQLFYNAIDETPAFIREQYYDFLNRTPDPGGLAFWIASIDSCGTNILCIENARIDASKEFFITQELQQTGFFVYRVRRASLGLQPNYGQYIIDKSLLGAGTENNKTAFAEAFAQSPEFLVKYPATQSGSAFIDLLITTINNASGVDLNVSGPGGTSRRPDLVNEYLLGATQAQSRARVIRRAIEYPEYTAVEFNPAFVLAQYYLYLRRGVDTAGYNFWLSRLNAGVGTTAQRAMVCSFLTSAEYQLRFAPTATRTNAECADVAP